ncbi:hypothetical protein COU54_01555 [Candidatus Pacearchaeota archaeon CG10_big_fil_rev_8_21_14_0_10_31_24]|nr:MAG: hypothetical protein COU54_01555 [Candidatus Pacearchaeota archaeon CG10_big_fil_rev_8_21_14_0_10_31_24]
MARIYEVTTIAGNTQKYETIEVSPIRFANNELGISIKTLENDGKSLEGLASHAYHVYSLTGLDEAIRQYSPKLLTEHDGERFTGAEIAKPDRLRLIYDAFPLGAFVPILRVCPTEGEQIYVAEYDFANAQLPLKKMTFSQEFEGSLDMQFTGLKVFLHLRNFEAENEYYYGRDLKKSGNVR